MKDINVNDSLKLEIHTLIGTKPLQILVCTGYMVSYKNQMKLLYMVEIYWLIHNASWKNMRVCRAISFNLSTEELA